MSTFLIRFQIVLGFILLIGSFFCFRFSVDNSIQRTLNELPSLLVNYADMVDSYKSVYESSNQTLEQLQPALRSIASKFHEVSSKCKTTGTGVAGFHLRKWYPLKDQGDYIIGVAGDIENISKTFRSSADLLNKYTQETYPRTLSAMAQTSKYLRNIANEIQYQRDLQRLLGFFIGVIFLLVGFFFQINGRILLVLLKNQQLYCNCSAN